MGKERLVAFTDGVVAIIITIMVLELKLPQGTTLHDLLPILPVFLSYLLSFVFVAIYWNNHHHLLQLAHRVTGPILWANMHLLFWLSLTPYAMRWIGENHLAGLPVALYGGLLLMNAIAYTILTICLIRLGSGPGCGPRYQGQDLAGDLCGRRRRGLLPALCGDRLLRLGGGDLVPPRPQGRAGSQGRVSVVR